MKKLLSLLTIMIFVLIGCGSDTADDKSITFGTHAISEDNPDSDEVSPDPAKSVAQKQMLDKYVTDTGIKIDYLEVPTEDRVEAITQSVLAGDPIADVLRVSSTEYMDLLAAGMLTDISKETKDYWTNGELVAPEATLGSAEALGGQYGVSTSLQMWFEYMVFDVNLIEQAGLEETPFEMWKDGRWTWTNARDYMLKLKSSLGEDYTIWAAEPHFVLNNGLGSGGNLLVDADGKNNMTSDSTYASLEYYKSLYDDGIMKFYLDEEGNPVWADSQTAWEKDGNVVFTTLEAWRSDCCIRNTEKEYGFVPYPISDDIKPEEFIVPATGGDIYVIPKGVKNVETAVQAAMLQHKMSNPEYYGFIPEGRPEGNIENPDLYGQWMTNNSFDPENKLVGEYMDKQSQINMYPLFSSGLDFNATEAFTEYLVNGTSMVSALESAVDLVNENIKKLESTINVDVDKLETEPKEEVKE